MENKETPPKGETLPEREERLSFIAQQLREYEQQNPEIRRVIHRVLRVEPTHSKHDFLRAMWSLIDGLRLVTEFLGKLPVITRKSADQAWDDLCEAPPDVLGKDDFDHFRYIIDMGFRISLDGAVQSPDIKRRAERIFAMILWMIQIETQQIKEGRTAD